jgi:hypothetical protein
LTVLQEIAGKGRGRLLTFLHGARLISEKPAVTLVGADIREAHLRGVHLAGACLQGTHLQGAYLEGANLLGADLAGAKPAGALGVDNERLHSVADSPENAVMPNGQKYEHWLISKRAEDE